MFVACTQTHARQRNLTCVKFVRSLTFEVRQKLFYEPQKAFAAIAMSH